MELSQNKNSNKNQPKDCTKIRKIVEIVAEAIRSLMVLMKNKNNEKIGNITLIGVIYIFLTSDRTNFDFSYQY